jgi:SAM-dependent methyltransferase
MEERNPIAGPRLVFDPPRDTCPLCESSSIAPFTRDARGIRIDRCRSCSLLFMNPQYTDETLSEYYTTYTGHDSGALAAGYHGPRRERKRRNLELLDPYLDRDARFLSIGCGDGLELTLARDRGYRVEAYDVDPVSAAAVRRATGIEVRSGDLFTAGFADESYDCVFLDQVLEHPKDPARSLRFAQRVLRTGGVLYLGVPNIASWSNAWKTLQDRLGIRTGSRRGKHFDTWHHLHYYSPRCLREVLEPRYGFRVLRMAGDPEPTGAAILYSLRRAWLAAESSLIVLSRKV